MGFTVSGILLVVYGAIELFPLLMTKKGKNMDMSKGPVFIFKPLQENVKMAHIMGGIFGVMRIIAAVGIFLNLFWGFALGVSLSIITYAVMTLYLPFGIMDGVLSGAILVTLLISYFGDKNIF